MAFSVGKLLLLGLGYFLTTGHCEPTCHAGWSYYEGSCYGFGSEEVTWGDAAEMCEIFHAKLVEIETSTENDYLKNLARSKLATSVWIGGTDIFSEGNWEWATSGVPIYPFSDWAPGEPNQSGDVGGEDCLQLVKNHSYRWNDQDCDLKAYFVCENEPNGETVVG